MPQQSKPITAQLIEYHCEQCQQGVYRAVGLAISNTSPKQWLHRRSACGDEQHFTVVYPMVRYKDRDFMLADSLRFGTPEKNVR